MGYDKIINLLGKLDKDDIPKFASIKWIEILINLMEIIIKVKVLDLKHHK